MNFGVSGTPTPTPTPRDEKEGARKGYKPWNINHSQNGNRTRSLSHTVTRRPKCYSDIAVATK